MESFSAHALAPMNNFIAQLELLPINLLALSKLFSALRLVQGLDADPNALPNNLLDILDAFSLHSKVICVLVHENVVLAALEGAHITTLVEYVQSILRLGIFAFEPSLLGLHVVTRQLTELLE